MTGAWWVHIAYGVLILNVIICIIDAVKFVCLWKIYKFARLIRLPEAPANPPQGTAKPRTRTFELIEIVSRSQGLGR